MSRKSYYKTANDFIEAKSNYSIPSYTVLHKNYINQDSSSKPVKLNMKYKTQEYASPEVPAVWGPAFWFTLHNGAARYPVKASSICAERMKNFILGIPVMIPCEKCKDHATAHIEANWRRLDEVVNGRQNLFNFFVDFHNYVNRRYNKPEMSYEEAFALYSGRTNVTKLSYEAEDK